MWTKYNLDNFVFFDIETTTQTENYEELPGNLPKLWEERCDYLRNMPSRPENKELTNQQLYEDKAPLSAEFGKIICLSYGKFIYPKDFDETTLPKLQYRALIGDETDIIKSFLAGVQKMITKTTHTRIVGHNIRRFDNPFMMKRAIINDIAIPPQINPYLVKPWDLAIVDSSEAWSFGAWQESFTPLKLLAEVLGIPSPKDDIDGSQVYNVFYKEKNINRIATYCNKDVLTQAKVTLRLAGHTTAQANSIILEEKSSS